MITVNSNDKNRYFASAGELTNRQTLFQLRSFESHTFNLKYIILTHFHLEYKNKRKVLIENNAIIKGQHLFQHKSFIYILRTPK